MGSMERLQEFFDKYAIQKETYTELSKPDCAGRQSLIISDIKDEIINDLSNRENDENIYKNMNKSLKKMYSENQITGKPSLYNKAEVLSVEEFEARFLS